jgi:DNA repair protein RadC
VTTELEGQRAPRTSKRTVLRIGPRVRVMLVRERAAVYTRPLISAAEVDALLREEMLASDRERFLTLMLNGKNKLLAIGRSRSGASAHPSFTRGKCSKLRSSRTLRH